MSAELSARRTAAAAVLADWHAAAAAFQSGGERPDYAMWALRLEQHMRYVLDALQVQDDARPPGAQLEEIRLVFEAFDWETDDRQYALEQIETIVNGDGR